MDAWSMLVCGISASGELGLLPPPRAPGLPGSRLYLAQVGQARLASGEGGEGVSVCTFLQCCWISWAFDAATSVVNDDHLSSSLVRLHDAVSFTDFIEAEDPGRLDVQPTRSGVCCDLLKRNVREREAWGSEDKLPKNVR